MIMKTKMPTALISSLLLAILACPVLAVPVDDFVAGTPLGAAAIPSSFGVDTVLGWWLTGAFTACPLGTLLTFLLAFCICALIAYSTTLNARAEDGGVLGDAHVKTGREVIKGSMTWDGSTNPSSRGFVYGFTKYHGKPCYLYEPKKMAFVSGATGSGKSRFLYLPSIDLLSYGGASNGSEPATLIVSDVKNELIELTGDELARRGYRVLLLDTQHPYRGQRFNPLKQVLGLHAEGRDQEAEQAADAIAELVVQDDEKDKGSHWTASARGLLSALVLLVSMSDECPEESKHLATVCEVLDRGTEAEGDDPSEPLKAVFRALPSGHPAKGRASQFVSSGGNELRSILSTLKVALRPFSSAPVAWMTSGSDIDPHTVLTEKSAVFLHVLDEGSPYNCIAAIFLSQLWASVQAVADVNGGRLPRPVQILGDEWGNLPRVECLPALLSLGRGCGTFWVGATQDVSQLNKYGERDGRRKILANCGVKIAMKLSRGGGPPVLHRAHRQDHAPHAGHEQRQSRVGHVILDVLQRERRRRDTPLGVARHGPGPGRDHRREARGQRYARMSSRRLPLPRHRLHQHAHKGALRPRDPRARGGEPSRLPAPPRRVSCWEDARGGLDLVPKVARAGEEEREQAGRQIQRALARLRRRP